MLWAIPTVSTLPNFIPYTVAIHNDIYTNRSQILLLFLTIINQKGARLTMNP